MHVELIDAKFCNSLFTWCGKDNKLSKPDREIVNWCWVKQGD